MTPVGKEFIYVFYLMAMINDTVLTMILRLLNIALADDKNCPLMNEGCSNLSP